MASPPKSLRSRKHLCSSVSQRWIRIINEEKFSKVQLGDPFSEFLGRDIANAGFGLMLIMDNEQRKRDGQAWFQGIIGAEVGINPTKMALLKKFKSNFL